MTYILTTERLYLREFLPDDAIHFYTMNADYDVLKYTGDVAFKSVDEAKLFLKNYKQYKLHNMGRWAVCLKSNDEFVGWCGLKFHPSENLVEVGYRFYKSHWNKGYATESAKACIDYGFETLGLKTIYAHAHVDNLASHHVINKCGFTLVNEAIYDGMPAKLYKIENLKS
ncbi:GNAT family N-acetyltransferase [Psychroserpens algicola]|uniref:GNAT family N-acetyltransferase n=1 Tax=Psychroserpens algicola TaxID=1719034 RepID=A0ABT0HA29_9FLAO|nr:GNAT family N-acetyltransferase [Psychroserpens algicola]MCK8481251.1 GNAT family N-acetyltransferase [Psychroserpens algicola]